MVQLLRAFAALAEVLRSVASTYIIWYITIAVALAPEDWRPLHASMPHTQIHIHTCT